MKDFTATIREDSPRAADWRKVYGGTTVILKHPLPAIGEFPGVGAKEFYELDLDALTEEQRARLIAHLSERFQLSLEEVQSELDTVGVPILAEDVTLTIHNPVRWLT